MFNIQEEQIRYIEENQARLSYFITHHVSQINQILKCSICFEVYERPTTVFNCNHVFCEECIKSYFEISCTKEPPCPICQKPIPRNNLQFNSFLAKVAEFGNFASGRFECNVSKAPSFETIFTNIKGKNEFEATVINKMPPDVILKAKKVLITSNKEVISSDVTTSLLNKLNTITTATKKDSFDAVKESPISNPLFKGSKITKTYSKPKPKQNEIFIHKTVEFEDEKNRMEILRWLHDPHNNFDSFPLTQQSNVSECKTQFDLPSVSQLHKHKVDPVKLAQINKLKLEQNKIREKSDRVTHLSRYDSLTKNKNDNRRTRSLDIGATEKQKLKRHSITAAEKIAIEQFDSQEEITNRKKETDNRIEEECLKNIEAIPIKKPPKRFDETMNNSSGWARIKDIKKTIGKVEKKPTKLSVSGVSRCTSTFAGTSKEDTVKVTSNCQPVVVLERMNFGTGRVKSPIEKTYDLYVLETYFSKKITDTKLLDSPSSNQNSSLSPNQLLVTALIHDEKDVNKTPILPVKRKRTNSGPIGGTNSKLFKPNLDEIITITDTPSADNKFKRESARITRSQSLRYDGSAESPKLNNEIHSIPELPSDYIVAKNGIEELQNPIGPGLNEDDLLMLPTQPVLSNENVSEKQEIPAADDDDIFMVSTQILDKEEDEKAELVNNLKSKIDSLQNVLDTPNFISKIMLLLKDIERTISLQETLTNDAQTQTVFKEHRAIALQTESFDSPKGFRISSTDQFLTQPVVNTEMQTDPMACPKCNFVLDNNKPKVNSLLKDSNIIRSLSEKYVLSGTFDNIYFETQDVIKGKKIDGSSSSDKTKLPVDLTPEPLSFKEPIKKQFKRIRKPSSDSDSEDVVAAKNVGTKNKFVEEDLSLHFASESQNAKPNDNANLNLSGNSDDIDYGQYLQNVLDKCDEDLINKKATPKKSKIKPPASKRSKSQEKMIKECELIMQEACSGTITFENTENINAVTATLPKPSTLTLNAMEVEFQTENFAENIPKPCKLTLTALEEEFQHDFNDDVIIIDENSNTRKNEANNRKDKLLSESLFSSDDNFSAKQNRLLPAAPLDELVDVLDEFNDSFQEEPKVVSPNPIVILQNIEVVPANQAEDKANESDEIFCYDSDVVETTPQKSKPVSLDALSQAYYEPEKIILPPIIDESPDIITSLDAHPMAATCLGEVFIPPPEFQDDQTVIDLCSLPLQAKKVAPSASLTPDLNLPETHDLFFNEPFITSTPYSPANDSQILPSKSLNLSPIKHGSNKIVNPIIAAQNSKHSPLTVVKSKTPPPQRKLLPTSTPKQKTILNYIESPQKSVVKRITKPIVSSTRMDRQQLQAITTLAKKKLITYSNTFNSKVTHMIVDVTPQNRVKDHTMKYVGSIAAGIWVLNIGWIQECLKQNQIVPEEPYEALDLTGIAGPKRSRLMGKKMPLLKDYKIHVAPPFRLSTKIEVENVIKALGGEVVSNLLDLKLRDGKVRLIITDVGESEEGDTHEMWLEMLKVVTVDLEWLSRCVGQYEKLSLRPFTLCSEESICDLGYPDELVAEGPNTLSHSINEA